MKWCAVLLVAFGCANDPQQAGVGSYALNGVCPQPFPANLTEYPETVCDRGSLASPRFATWDECLREARLAPMTRVTSYGCNHPEGYWASQHCPRIGSDPGGTALLMLCTPTDAARTIRTCTQPGVPYERCFSPIPYGRDQ